REWGAGEQPGDRVDGPAIRGTAVRKLGGDALAARAFGVVAPRKQQTRRARLQQPAEFDPVLLWPLLAVLSGRMQCNRVGRNHGVGYGRAIEPVVDLTLRHVTKRER